MFSRLSKKIDINTANAGALKRSFKRIGGEECVQYGPFKSVSGLAQVKGFGASFIEWYETELEKTLTPG